MIQCSKCGRKLGILERRYFHKYKNKKFIYCVNCEYMMDKKEKERFKKEREKEIILFKKNFPIKSWKWPFYILGWLGGGYLVLFWAFIYHIPEYEGQAIKEKINRLFFLNDKDYKEFMTFTFHKLIFWIGVFDAIVLFLLFLINNY